MLAWWRCKSVVSHGGFSPKPQSEVPRRSRRSAPVGGHNVANPSFFMTGGVSSYEKTLLHTSEVRPAPFVPVNLTMYHEPLMTLSSLELLNSVSTVPACSARRLSLVECSDQCTFRVTPSPSTMYSAQLILRSVDSLSPKPCAGNERCQYV